MPECKYYLIRLIRLPNNEIIPPMKDLIIPRDAFSHGQIKSKLWLAESFSRWVPRHLDTDARYELNWYGSWVGIGPFLLLTGTGIQFRAINLFDLNAESLEASQLILDYWRCEAIEITTRLLDVNTHLPPVTTHQIFINTACEHMENDSWLQNLPAGSVVLLQSTDMQHLEHINCSRTIEDFVNKKNRLIQVLESDQIHFAYPDKKFSRFMLFGIKK